MRRWRLVIAGSWHLHDSGRHHSIPSTESSRTRWKAGGRETLWTQFGSREGTRLRSPRRSGDVRRLLHRLARCRHDRSFDALHRSVLADPQADDLHLRKSPLHPNDPSRDVASVRRLVGRMAGAVVVSYHREHPRAVGPAGHADSREQRAHVLAAGCQDAVESRFGDQVDVLDPSRPAHPREHRLDRTSIDAGESSSEPGWVRLHIGPSFSLVVRRSRRLHRGESRSQPNRVPSRSRRYPSRRDQSAATLNRSPRMRLRRHSTVRLRSCAVRSTSNTAMSAPIPSRRR